MRKLVMCAVVLVVGVFNSSIAIGSPARGEPAGLAALARQAISEDQIVSQQAIQQLRSAGPVGLAALLELLPDRDPAPFVSRQTEVKEDPALRRLSSAIDAVAAQRDASVSRLYWHTDLDAARALARRTNRPILSLHMLGKLTSEYSCANSRFFRTALYANRDVSAMLRERFVLHWKTVRQVPRITIDFGDGRKLQNTITGNSIHYVLDPDGRLIEAVPGLYGPQAFMRILEDAARLAEDCATLPETEREARIREYHQKQSGRLLAAWRDDLCRIGVLAPGETGSVNENKLRQWTDDSRWGEIAALHFADAKLDAASVALVRRDMPRAIAAGLVAMTKSKVEDPLLRLVAGFQRSIAEDTVRNEYLLHRAIHDWFTAMPTPANLELFNQRVYAELFLMPLDDPWLGLLPKANYSALKNAGIVVESVE